MSERVPALMAAFSTAMSARARQVTAQQVDEMRIKAEELLDRRDPVRAAVLTFATMYEQHRHDHDLVASLGDDLEAAVRGAVAPSQPEHWWQRDG